jgi:hypothetical protein
MGTSDIDDMWRAPLVFDEEQIGDGIELSQSAFDWDQWA